jgi:hypothetical protein
MTLLHENYFCTYKAASVSRQGIRAMQWRVLRAQDDTRDSSNARKGERSKHCLRDAYAVRTQKSPAEDTLLKKRRLILSNAKHDLGRALVLPLPMRPSART